MHCIFALQLRMLRIIAVMAKVIFSIWYSSFQTISFMEHIIAMDRQQILLSAWRGFSVKVQLMAFFQHEIFVMRQAQQDHSLCTSEVNQNETNEHYKSSFMYEPYYKAILHEVSSDNSQRILSMISFKLLETSQRRIKL